jgi:hypothetical protein
MTPPPSCHGCVPDFVAPVRLQYKFDFSGFFKKVGE